MLVSGSPVCPGCMVTCVGRLAGVVEKGTTSTVVARGCVFLASEETTTGRWFFPRGSLGNSTNHRAFHQTAYAGDQANAAEIGALVTKDRGFPCLVAVCFSWTSASPRVSNELRLYGEEDDAESTTAVGESVAPSPLGIPQASALAPTSDKSLLSAIVQPLFTATDES